MRYLHTYIPPLDDLLRAFDNLQDFDKVLYPDPNEDIHTL